MGDRKLDRDDPQQRLRQTRVVPSWVVGGAQVGVERVSRGLRVIFDPAIDRGVWLGPTSRPATFGEAWLGPSGLLGRLELELGCGGAVLSALERASALVTKLATRGGWWRASYEADPLGTCQRLLRDRDLLALWGWRGEAASDRLAELWAATTNAAPGIPDRLRDIHAALEHGPLPIDCVDVLSPVAGLPTLWRTVLGALADVGVRVTETPGPAARAPVDVNALTMLRPHGPLAAADEVAASLAALPSLAGVLVIGGDDVLDAALHRHGLPRLGAPAQPAASVALVRLVVEAAFEPMEAGDLHSLLCIDPGPIPRALAVPLIAALTKLPGRRSHLWRAAADDALAKIDESRRGVLRERIEMLLMPAARRGDKVAAAEILSRLHLVGTWARGRAESEPSLGTVALLVARAAALVARLGMTEVTLTQLRRLVDDLDDDAALAAVADAGLAGVAEPGAVLGPADVIVWWGFTRQNTRKAAQVRLSLEEHDRLVRLGVTPPDLGAVMQAEATRWRRPFEAARTLILVCPQTDETGEREFPHPLWDELCAELPDRRAAARLEKTRLDLTRRAVPPRSLPAPSVTSQAGRPLPLRDPESPSSLARLLGCSLSWALHYHGRVQPGLSSGAAAPTPLLYGTIAHHLLARVFRDGALGADAAADEAARVVDDELSAICETLDLPRYQVERAAVKHAIVESARELGRLITATGASVRGVEVEVRRSLGGVTIRGYADLILGCPDAVLDLKWGRSSYIDKLKAGTALQLAAYAEPFAEDASRPEVAYFLLGKQQLVGEPGSVFPGVTIPGSTTSDVTWRAALAALERRRAELAAGELFAPAGDGTEIESRLGDGLLTLAPECTYCELGGLCGQRGCV